MLPHEMIDDELFSLCEFVETYEVAIKACLLCVEIIMVAYMCEAGR